MAREPLHGEVEIDEAWIGGPQAGWRGSRQLKGRRAALVLVAVEKRGKASGRLRMAVIPDFKATTLSGFIQHHIAPGSTIYTDALKSFTGLDKSWVSAHRAGAAEDNRIAQGSQIGSALGRPCYRQPPAMVDWYLPRRQPCATSSLPQ